MAFGIKKKDLQEWKRKIDRGQIAFLTHYWLDERFPGCTTVTKVGCNDMEKLIEWGKNHGLQAKWIHIRKDGYSHFDLIGERQTAILKEEGLMEHIW
ncbi:hypothetical protein BGM26_06260 [Bacillus sp. FJAT-29790]|uniref:hypothetical protein n=1 Tax=Bacillus sp. FJAT-29790 TaxID=1895002 RepID=UPI001C21A4C3|nr:hypothetical protein [Bacillus sp. FJAT-29790]MBU8878591.1 hypothetical protein [Bacillus sp. FJAT-29790]